MKGIFGIDSELYFYPALASIFSLLFYHLDHQTGYLLGISIINQNAVL